MAILCVRIAPNDHPDPSLHAQRTHPGDVVDIVEDDHVFSEGELKCGQYRFINVPGVPAAELAHLKESVLAADGAVSRKRGRGFDADELNSPQWKNRDRATKAQIDAITRERP